MNTNSLIQELSDSFSLSEEQARTACVLLEARARTLDYTLDEYMERYHPAGLTEKDEYLDERWNGYVSFLKGDAAAILGAGKGADFSTFVHECAHVFRRQLAGDLRDQAEQAFKVEGGAWTENQEELFAKGLEQWIKRRHGRDKTRAEVYNKGKQFVDDVYRGMERVVDIDPRMEAVYERLFEDNTYTFNKDAYEGLLAQIKAGLLLKDSFVSLGMTPRIYEDIGLERLPLGITGRHLYTTLRESGVLEGADVRYHDLDVDILKQLPEQLKKPLCVVQSENDETDIVSIVALRDKQNRQVIVPIAQNRKGYVNNVEIDVNMVKSVYGRDGFAKWLEAAFKQDRVLYINKKETELALNGKLTHTVQDHSISQLRKEYPLAQDVSGFSTENIARFREAVNAKFGRRPESFTHLYQSENIARFREAAGAKFGRQPENFSILYQKAVRMNGGQLAFDFTPPEQKNKTPPPAQPEINVSGKTESLDEKIRRNFRIDAPPVDIHSRPVKQERGPIPAVPPDLQLPNTPEHFVSNFIAASEMFPTDRVEAARYVLRAMPARARKTVIDGFRENGLDTPQAIRGHLTALLDRAARSKTEPERTKKTNAELFNEKVQQAFKAFERTLEYNDSGVCVSPPEETITRKNKNGALEIEIHNDGGRYFYGLDYYGKDGGMGFAASVFDQTYPSLAECRKAAVDYLKRYLGEKRAAVFDSFRLQDLLENPGLDFRAGEAEAEGRDIDEQAAALLKTVIEGGDLMAHAAEPPAVALDIPFLEAERERLSKTVTPAGHAVIDAEGRREIPVEQIITDAEKSGADIEDENIKDESAAPERLDDFLTALPHDERQTAQTALAAPVFYDGDFIPEQEVIEKLFDKFGDTQGAFSALDIIDSNIVGKHFFFRGHEVSETGYRYAEHLHRRLEARQEMEDIEESAAPNRAEEPAIARNTGNKTAFRPFGAWTDFDRRLSTRERERLNAEALHILENAAGKELNDVEKGILRRYSGFGGIAAENERGVLYDYYTSPPVADLTWRLVEKSGAVRNGASILEPSCGTGVFFETAPQDRALNLTGVELDSRTAAVAKALREKDGVQIINQSFEAFNLSEKHGGFDVVIGNVPFGERSPETAALDMPGETSLDNYFVSRSLDNLKSGGLMALITAPGVLENKSNEQFRLEMNRKAQFAGALKLPNKSFSHANTSVQPDILLFRKYPDDVINRLSAVSDETFKTTPLYDKDFVGGTYFQKHPEHIIGTLSAGTGQWGADEVLGEVTPEIIEKALANFTPADTDLLENAYAFARGAFPAVDSDDSQQTLRLTGAELDALTGKTLSEGELKTYEKKLYLLTSRNEWLRVSDNENLTQKIDEVKRVSNYVKEIQSVMRNGAPAALEAMPEGGYNHAATLQAMCRALLDDYKTKYGALPKDDADIKRFTREYPAVKGVYESFLAPGDALLTSENVYRKNIETVDGHNPAIAALLSLRQTMKPATEEHIRAAFPANADSLIAEMKTHPDVFITPHGEWRLREDFISGDAWKQIDALRDAAERESEPWKQEKLRYGADEFEKAVGWTPIEDAAFSPRSSWIPQEIVRGWVSSDDGLGHLELSTLSKNNQDKWGVLEKGAWREEAAPLVYYLNGQKQRSKYFNTDAFNAEHDDLFRSFISGHEQYRETLEQAYNRAFKTHIVSPVKTYPVDISGWKDAGTGGKTLKPHQWQSIHHLYRQGSGVSALGTGFGKTVTAIGLLSLMRQEGKSNRVFLQVPNNKVKDWIAEIKSVMPSLKIAACDPEEPGYSSRDKRYAKYQQMARSNADIVIMPESAASEIQLTAANDARISDKIASQYKLEKADASARAQELAEIKGERKAAAGKTNRTVSFEDFGCDCVIVDEAHNYKNLFSSSLSRETGMNDGRQSAKAMSLFKKSEFIREQNNGKNVFLLTATPLTNSPLEYYNMLQYIAPEELQRLGVHTIDGFIREFAHIEMGWIYDWGKGQAKEGRVLTGFKNLPTLQNLFFTYTDLQNNPDAIGIEKPLAENRPNVIPRDERQVQAVKSISDRLDRYKGMDAQEREINFPGENFLTFYSQMRAASLDLELYDPHAYKGWKNPKLETLAKNAFDSYQNTKGGQVVFCDRVFSSDASFNIHEKIKNALVVQGFKEKDIVIVNGFTKSGGNKSDGAIEKEVSKAIADYNAGKYKVIIASTACAGEGVNLQKNSAALHHFDIPFRPSDFIQRNGRIDRQGNEQDNVTLHTYLAAGTIDNYSVNLVQRKANWIDQLLRTKSEVFTNPNDENAVDADELLLALTEEWGDKQAARERRAEMEKTKREKIREAQTAQTHSYMKNLSLARASRAALEGRENTKAYQKRCEQIAGLEKALARNETFTHKDILQSREPFLYNQKSGAVFRTGDVLVTRNGSWLVESLNSKKQELNCSALVTDTERGKKEQDARAYGTGDRWKKTSFKVSELEPEGERYNYNAVLSHFEKPDAALRAVIRDAAGEDFYRLPDNARANYYDLHLKICGERYGGFRPATLSIGQSGKLAVEHGFPANRKPLNPFSPEGKAAVDDALKKGLDESVSGWQTALVTLQNALPDVGKKAQAAADSQAQTRREAEQHAEGAEQNRKNQALQKALAKLNPNVTVTSPVVKTGRSR